MKNILSGLLAAALFATPALAGIKLSEIPANGKANYVQLPDGTYAAQKGNADGSINAVTSATGVFLPATVGTSSAQVIAAGVATIYLMLHNPSAAGGNTVYCRSGSAAAVGTAGNLSIAPGQYVTMEASLVDGGAWNCIATGTGTPFTYGAK